MAARKLRDLLETLNPRLPEEAAILAALVAGVPVALVTVDGIMRGRMRAQICKVLLDHEYALTTGLQRALRNPTIEHVLWGVHDLERRGILVEGVGMVYDPRAEGFVEAPVWRIREGARPAAERLAKYRFGRAGERLT